LRLRAPAFGLVIPAKAGIQEATTLASFALTPPAASSNHRVVTLDTRFRGYDKEARFELAPIRASVVRKRLL
jgi:hypothetical protein